MRNPSMMKFWAAAILISGATAASGPAWAATVNCNNNSGDAAAIQSAINAGGTATITGTCDLGTNKININNSVTITGGAKFVATASYNDWSFIENVDNVTFTNLTFDNAGIKLASPGASGNATHDVKRTNVNITHCAFQNFTTSVQGASKDAAIEIDPIWRNSVVEYNTFTNIWYTGYPNGRSTYWSLENTSTYALHGLIWFGGLDGTVIDYNSCNEIAGNCIKGFDNGLSSNTNGYTAAYAEVSYNTGVHVHRIGIEWQNQSGNCTGGCGGFAVAHSSIKVAGNFFHTYAILYNDSFGLSLPTVTTHEQVINNAAIRDTVGNPDAPGGPFGYGMEMVPGTGCKNGSCVGQVAPGGYTIQGNLISADKSNIVTSGGSSGWEAAFLTYGSKTQQLFQNNYRCGYDHQTVSITSNPNEVGQYDYVNSNSCPAGTGSALYASNLSNFAFTSSNNQNFQNGGNGTWTLGVISNLPIRNVQFSVGGSVVKTQEIQDVSTTFQNDLTWRYSVTFNTSNYGQGGHTITATGTDISGATKSASQTFTVGNVAAAKPTISSFSANPASITSGQSTTLSWTTTGATSLSIDNGIGDVSSKTSIAVSPIQTTTYTLTATNGNGSVTAQTSVTVSASGNPGAPAAASNLTGYSPDTASVIINWKDNSNNETGFIIQRRATQGSSPFATVTTLGANVVTYTDAGLTAYWQYDYQVIATNASGNAAPSNTVTVQVGVTQQANPCDLNGDGSVTVADVQLAVNKVLGVTTPCGTADINEDGQCTVADVQRLVNAVLTGVCKVGP